MHVLLDHQEKHSFRRSLTFAQSHFQDSIAAFAGNDFHQDTCTHIIIDDSKGLTVPNDVRKEVPVVKVEWFWASIQMDACAEEKLHLYSSDPNSYLSPGGALFSPGTPGT
mgnify:CR=1 FL=1